MSKTAEEIGLIVGGIALAVAGFDPAIFGLTALHISAAELTFIGGIGVSAALSGAGLALRQTPQGVGTANSISVANGVAPRRVIHGQFQTAGVLTYASFPPSQNLLTTNQYLHLVYTLAAHEIYSFDAVVIDGMIYNFVSDLNYPSGTDTTWHVDPGPNASPTDFYWQHMQFEFDFGRPQDFGQPFPNLAAADSAWTADCRQQGCAKVHVVLRADINWPAVFPAGLVPNIQFLVTGKKIADPRVVTEWQASTVYSRYQYTIDNNGIVWVLVTGGGTSGATRPNFEALDTFGTTLTDGSCTWQSCWISDIIGASSMGVPWGRRLINDAWVVGGFTQFSIIESPAGYYQMCTTNAVVGGTDHPDFATTLGTVTADGSQSWVCLGRSPNAANLSNCALVVNDYLQDSDYGLNVPAAQIDLDALIAAANVCEEQALIIWNPDGSTVFENLYSCDGMFDYSSQRGDVLIGMCNSMAGWVIPPGDLWHIFAGAYSAPTVSLTDDDMRGPIKGDFRLSKREVANGVKGTFVPAFLPASPAAAFTMNRVPGTWQAQPFPAYQANGLAGKPDYLNSEDNGEILWQDLRLDFTTSLWTAQRLAKITLMRLRFQQTLTLPCKMTAFALESGDTFTFIHKRWSLIGNFEISEDSIAFDASGKDNVPTVGVDLMVRQTDPSIYEFTAPSSPSNYGEYSPYGVTGVMTGVE